MIPPVDRSLILSVRPRFAEAILRGDKTAELRRKRPTLAPGALAFMYVSSPVRSVTGILCIRDVVTAPVEVLWQQLSHRAFITREDFEDYFSGVSVAHAIMIANTLTISHSLTLADLRDIWPGFRPPQSFAYLVPGDKDASRFLRAVRRRLWSLSGDDVTSQSDPGGERHTERRHSVTGDASSHARLYLQPGAPARTWLNHLRRRPADEAQPPMQ